jgi:hypothetical protein
MNAPQKTIMNVAGVVWEPTGFSGISDTTK